MGIESILAERGNRYGEFKGHALITQDIKRAMAKSKNWNTISDDKKECLEMIAHKIGRALNGDPEYTDNFTDIIGYAKLVEDELKKVESQKAGAEWQGDTHIEKSDR
tara:strand:+ start:425 stop:745 length:321 start_codon:yes stop_codon:yes gene_type:complete